VSTTGHCRVDLIGRFAIATLSGVNAAPRPPGGIAALILILGRAKKRQFDRSLKETEKAFLFLFLATNGFNRVAAQRAQFQ
jgi:hypothetical protein